MKKTIVSYLGVASALALFTPSAFAALAITNGDFETGGGDNVNDVTGWFDYSTGGFWEGAWQTNNGGITPNGTNVVVISSFGATSDPFSGQYLYQGIGTADGASSVTIGFDFGAPNDDPGGRTLGMTVGIYAYDGVGTFAAGDGVSIYAASQTAGSGVTLLSSNSDTQLVTTGVDGLIGSYEVTLGLSGAGAQQLFLGFNNYAPVGGDSWPVLDNIAIVPEPSAALLGGLGVLGLLRRRRR